MLYERPVLRAVTVLLPFESSLSLFFSSTEMSRFRVVEHIIPAHNYIPFDNPSPQEGDVTLIGAHACAFPKELYEPLWDYIYDGMRGQNRSIRSIWIADVAQQGQSGVLNESILGNDPSLYDHGRDLLSLLNYFKIPQPLIGVGHSMGGVQLAHLSLMHPSLFTGLILIDPVIQPDNPSHRYALPSTYRRDIWPSRKEPPKNFENWIKFGLRDVPTKQYPISQGTTSTAVTLTTPKAQELFTYLRPSYIDKRSGVRWGNPRDEMFPEDIDDIPFYRPEPSHIFRRIPELKPIVLYIFGGNSDISIPAARKEKMRTTGTGIGGSGGAACGKVQEVVLPCGHLVPMELPQESAKACTAFIDTALSYWTSESVRFLEAWERIPNDELIRIDTQWEDNIGHLPKRPKL
ncbi:unnamed protein product [Penicillium salamii]|nr:unnamed protein product [Penicillium salamii]CAG8285003.1 unnamed protein product [Penicillium salamii]CAG8398618.1 unnamed protein product [Penicillium salamii]